MGHLGRFDYYDALLAAIAASLALGLSVGLATSIPLRTAMAGGCLIATVFVFEGVYRNPPVDASSTAARVASITWFAFVALILASLTL